MARLGHGGRTQCRTRTKVLIEWYFSLSQRYRSSSTTSYVSRGSPLLDDGIDLTPQWAMCLCKQQHANNDTGSTVRVAQRRSCRSFFCSPARLSSLRSSVLNLCPPGSDIQQPEPIRSRISRRSESHDPSPPRHESFPSSPAITYSN